MLKNISCDKLLFPLYALLLVLFVNSGFVKSFFKAASFVEIDITILSMLMLTPLSMFLLINRRLKIENIIVIALILLFFIFYTASVLYTTSDTYYINKLTALTGLLSSLLFGISSNEVIRFYFYKYYAVFAVLAVSIYFVLTFSNLSPESLNDFTGNSLVAGEMLGASLLIFYYRKSRFKNVLIFFSFAVMIALGARGPLLFSLVILLFIALGNMHKINIKAWLKFGMFTVISILIIGNSTSNDITATAMKKLNDGYSRFELLFSEDKGDSVNSRTVMIAKTIEHIDRNIFLGSGVGSFGVEIYGRDFRAYPHNVPLEIWFESGLIAFLLFNLFFFLILFNVAKNREFLLLSLLVYLYFNMNKSSSLEELRLFFLLTGFSIGAVKFNKFKRNVNV